MLLEHYQTKRMQYGNKPATVNRLVATLKHMFTKAVEWDMVEEEVLKHVRRVKFLEENNRRLRYLSKGKCQELINNCESHLKPIVTTALNTGMRKGEILNLKWDNVDLKHGFILLDMTKNGERREIPINDTLRSILQGITRRLDMPFVFFDSKTSRPYHDVKRSFNTACRRSKIKDFRFHDLRHTFASHLVMAGVDITTVKELLGHKTLSMTLRYAHLAPSHKVKAVNILDGAINQTAKTNPSRQPTIQKLYNPTFLPKKEVSV
jgi:integrase